MLPTSCNFICKTLGHNFFILRLTGPPMGNQLNKKIKKNFWTFFFFFILRCKINKLAEPAISPTGIVWWNKVSALQHAKLHMFGQKSGPLEKYSPLTDNHQNQPPSNNSGHFEKSSPLTVSTITPLESTHAKTYS